MNSILIVFAVISCAFCFLFFSRVTTLSIFKINYYSFLLYYNILILSFFGVILISLGWEHDDVNNLVSVESKYYGSLYVILGILTFSFFVFFFSKILGVNNFSIQCFMATPYESSGFLVLVFFSLINVFVFFALIYFLYNLDVVPILHIISGDLNVLESTELRSNAVFNLSPTLNFIRMIGIPLSQIVYFFFLSEFFKNKNIFLFLILVISFFNAVLFQTYGGDKAPLAMFLIGHIFFLVIIFGRIKIIYFVLAFLLGSAAMAFMYISTMTGLGESLLFSFLNRLLVSQISGTYLAMQHYDSIEPFIGFSSQNASLLNFFGKETSLRASERLVEYYFTASYDAGHFKNINSIFLHEAWSNFGLLGAVFSPIWVAFLFTLNFFILTRFGKNPVTIAFLTYFTYETSSFSTSFNAYVFSLQYLFLLAFFVISILILQMSKPREL